MIKCLILTKNNLFFNATFIVFGNNYDTSYFDSDMCHREDDRIVSRNFDCECISLCYNNLKPREHISLFLHLN